MEEAKVMNDNPEHSHSHNIHRLANDPIKSLLKYYAIPSIVGQVVNSLYNIVDRVYIGHFVGSLAISGLAITFPILLFLQAFGVLIGAGAASRISILLGQKNTDTAEQVLGNAVVLSLLFSLSAITVSYIFMDPLLRAFGASEQILPYARDYLEIVVPGNIFANLTFSYNAVIRATGHPRKAMVTMMIGAVLNVILDPIFIIGFDMGIRGAAWATVVSMFVGMIWVGAHFYSKDSLLRIRSRNFRLRRQYVAAILSIGISPFLVNFAASLISVVRNNVLSYYGGDLAVGAYGIVNSIASLILMVVLGLAFGMQPIVGYNYGAGNKKRVLETLWTTARVNTITGGIGTLLALFAPQILVLIFTTDPELIAVTVPAIQIELSMMWAVGFMITVTQFFQSIGMAWRTIILSLSRQVIFLIPLLIIFPRYMGLTGAWVAPPVADLVALVLSILMLVHFLRRERQKEIL